MTMWNRAAAAAVLGLVMASGRCWAEGEAADVSAELRSLKLRIAELEARQNENWLTTERTAQIRSIVEDVIADAHKRGQFADGPDAGYNNGFYFQTADKKFKIVFNGFVQARYEFAQFNADNGRNITSGGGSSSGSPLSSDPANSNGFDIRRARLSLSGNIFSPDVTFKLEGDFYGSATGAFTVTDAFIGYRFTDMFKVKTGSYKTPFAKAELTSDTAITFMERPEVLLPFDPVRSLGVSVYGDIIKDRLAYEVNANDGGGSNTLRRVSTVGTSANLDNRMAFYTRMQYAGAGKIADFADESDVRDSGKPRPFIWMLGGAVGYESQNSVAGAFPSPQTGTGIPGVSSNDSPGFRTGTLKGDVFRGTLDFSAKYQGFSFLAAAYFQQFNQNEPLTGLPTGYTADKASFFQHGYYGQIGYFVIPDRLELAARAGTLLTEGGPNIGEFYSIGANYYVYGHNFKISSDVTFTPEAPYTDAAASLLQNTHDVIFRVQAQLKF
jgi:hypothetical protein